MGRAGHWLMGGSGWRSAAAPERASHLLTFPSFNFRRTATCRIRYSHSYITSSLVVWCWAPPTDPLEFPPRADARSPRPGHPETRQTNPSVITLPPLYTPYAMPSTLRRRGPPAPDPPASESPSEQPTSRDESPAKPGETVKVIHHRARPRKRGVTAIFLLGSLFGLIGAGFFAKNNDLIAFPEIGELSMDSLFDVLPATFMRDIRDLVVRMPVAHSWLMHPWS